MGIHISGGRRPFTLAALDGSLRLLALSRGEDQEVLGFCTGLSSVLVTINAPSGPNIGLMSNPEFRQKMSPPPRPHPGRPANMRVAEYEGRLRGLNIPRTPGNVAGSPGWMRSGFDLYKSLSNLEFSPFQAENSNRQWLESQAETFFYALLGAIPFEANSLEGRIQRQLVLYDLELPVKNPMTFFEEVTRYRLLHSILPADNILEPAELNALGMAYLGWMAIYKPERITRLGAAEEGQITVPILPIFEVDSSSASVNLKNRF